MKFYARIMVIIMLLILVIIAGYTIISYLYGNNAVALVSIEWGPYLTNTTTSSTVISFKTTAPDFYSIEYATDDYYSKNSKYAFTVSDSENSSIHHVPVKNLAPDTLYHYRIVSKNGVTPDYHFRTFGNGSFTFIAYGDTRSASPATNEEKHGLVADRIAGENASFVIHSGDFVYSGYDLKYWNDFFSSGHNMLANLTIFPAPGNHEKNSPNYYEAFDMPEWYSFDYGDVHFTVLDSCISNRSAETQWLKKDLAVNKTWKIVVFHHPIYCLEADHLDEAAELKDWENIMLQNGVDLVINGHAHTYERINERGIMYIVAGTGGAPFNDVDEVPTPSNVNSQSDIEYTIGYVRITVSASELTIEYLPVANLSSNNDVISTIPKNTVKDTVTLKKQAR